MPEPPRPADVPKVSCTVCLKEVPKSEAKLYEARDYVLHFCGLDCFDQWVRDQQGKHPTAPSD